MNQNLYFQRGIQIITKLNEITPQAYLVGGVVRDYLLKQPFNDIDIATSATPEQVLELFPNAIQEFAEYGCVTIKEDDMIFEITTFREEVYGKQSRKPSEIHYSRKLQDDIYRRDFTINALAMPKSLVLVDLVDGQKDLKNKIIRSIGNPKNKFKEDPLRILRGLSLMAKLGFTIERNTLKGMIKCRKCLSEVANIKLTAELANIFSQPNGKKVVKLIIKNQLFKYVNNYHRWLKIILKKYDKLSTIEKFIILYRMQHQVMENSCFNKETIQKIKEIIGLADMLESRMINAYDVYLYQTEDLLSADLINQIMLKKYSSQAKEIDNLAKNKVINQRNDMVINAKAIIDLADGATGPFVNEILVQLEKDITSEKVKNNLEEMTKRTIELLQVYGINKDQKEQETKKEPVIDSVESKESSEISLSKISDVSVKEDIQLNEIDDLLNSIKPTINDLTTIETNEKQKNEIIEEPMEREENNQEQSLNELLKEYEHEYQLLLDRKMIAAIDEKMSLNEINEIKENLQATVRLLTIKANPKFEILLEKGLI